MRLIFSSRVATRVTIVLMLTLSVFPSTICSKEFFYLRAREQEKNQKNCSVTLPFYKKLSRITSQPGIVSSCPKHHPINDRDADEVIHALFCNFVEKPENTSYCNNQNKPIGFAAIFQIHLHSNRSKEDQQTQDGEMKVHSNDAVLTVQPKEICYFDCHEHKENNLYILPVGNKKTRAKRPTWLPQPTSQNNIDFTPLAQQISTAESDVLAPILPVYSNLSQPRSICICNLYALAVSLFAWIKVCENNFDFVVDSKEILRHKIFQEGSWALSVRSVFSKQIDFVSQTLWNHAGLTSFTQLLDVHLKGDEEESSQVIFETVDAQQSLIEYLQTNHFICLKNDCPEVRYYQETKKDV